jgi:hypothetical protein
MNICSGSAIRAFTRQVTILSISVVVKEPAETIAKAPCEKHLHKSETKIGYPLKQRIIIKFEKKNNVVAYRAVSICVENSIWRGNL